MNYPVHIVTASGLIENEWLERVDEALEYFLKETPIYIGDIENSMAK